MYVCDSKMCDKYEEEQKVFVQTNKIDKKAQNITIVKPITVINTVTPPSDCEPEK